MDSPVFRVIGGLDAADLIYFKINFNRRLTQYLTFISIKFLYHDLLELFSWTHYISD